MFNPVMPYAINKYRSNKVWMIEPGCDMDDMAERIYQCMRNGSNQNNKWLTIRNPSVINKQKRGDLGNIYVSPDLLNVANSHYYLLKGVIGHTILNAIAELVEAYEEGTFSDDWCDRNSMTHISRRSKFKAANWRLITEQDLRYHKAVRSRVQMWERGWFLHHLMDAKPSDSAFHEDFGMW